MQFNILLAFTLAAMGSAAAFPAAMQQKRDDNSSISVDWAALAEDTLASLPEVVVPLATTNDSVTIDYDAAEEEAIANAFQQTVDVTGIDNSTDTSSRKRGLSRRAYPDGCGALQSNPASALTSQFNLVTLSDFTSSTALIGSAGESTFNQPSILSSGVKYTRVYSNKKAAYTGVNYLGMRSIPRYNTAYCGQICNDIRGCQSFNIYFERDPKYDATDACPDPEAIINVACSFWGEPITLGGATNTGQYRKDFQVAIAGSTAYTMAARTPKTLAGYTSSIKSGGNLDNRVATGDPNYAPAAWANQNIILATTTIAGVPYDEAWCKAVADSYSSAQSFSTFQQIADDKYMGQGCIVYSQKDFTDAQFNDPGQWRAYSAAAQASGKTGNVFWQSNPVVFYSKSS